MSVSVKVFKTVNFIGLYLGKVIWGLWRAFAFLIKHLWIALYFIPGHAFNMTLNYTPRGWKEWLNPFAYGVMDEQKDLWNYARKVTGEESGDGGFFALCGILGSFFVGLFLFLTFPVCGLIIRLYIKGQAEDLEKKWEVELTEALKTDGPEEFRE